MTELELKDKRDAAFAEYLKVKKAGGKSPAKLQRLIAFTLALYRRERDREAQFDTVIHKALAGWEKSA